MSQSFSSRRADDLPELSSKRRRVLVTGAAGNIGSYFAEHLHERYELRPMVQTEKDGVEKIRQYGEVVEATLDDLEPVEGAVPWDGRGRRMTQGTGRASRG